MAARRSELLTSSLDPLDPNKDLPLDAGGFLFPQSQAASCSLQFSLEKVQSLGLKTLHYDGEAQQTETGEEARLPQAYVHQGWTEGFVTTPRTGTKTLGRAEQVLVLLF